MRNSALLRDPYPVFKRLRFESPVSQLEPEGFWLVARHADALTVLKQGDLFRSSGNAKLPAETDPEYLLKTRSLLGAEPPEHSRLRGLMRDAFTPPRMRNLEDQIRALVRERILKLRERGEFDLVSELATPLPMEVMATLLGIDPRMAGEFKRWADILVTWGSPDCPASEADVINCATEMRGYFSREIAARQRGGKDDEGGLLTFLSRRVDEADQALAPGELIAFARLLLVAGTETTTQLIGNITLALLEQPGLWSRVRKDRSRIPDLIEESLRFDSPVPALIRRASADTSLAGVTIRKNEIVMPLLGSANHDETVFQNPEQFELDRPPRAHLSFGAGPHYCMGVILARIQARVVFDEFLEAFSAIERTDVDPIARVQSFFVRGPVRLPVKITL